MIMAVPHYKDGNIQDLGVESVQQYHADNPEITLMVENLSKVYVSSMGKVVFA